MEWHLENPALALKEYHDNYETFRKKKCEDEDLHRKLTNSETQLGRRKEELEREKISLHILEGFTGRNVDAQIQEEEEQTQCRLAAGQAAFEEQKNRLAEQREQKLRENDQWLSGALKQFSQYEDNLKKDLTGIEKRALDFEADRRQYINQSNRKINEFEDSIVQGDLECKTTVNGWKQEQDAIREKFAPEITKYKELIQGIIDKYQPNVNRYEKIVKEQTALRDEELEDLEAEREREVGLIEDEIARYQASYNETESQYNEQIQIARMQNKPTVRLESSKTSNLNSIKGHIQKANNRAKKKSSEIERKKSAVHDKYDKRIEKAAEELQKVEYERDQELNEPLSICCDLTEDRDGQIRAIQKKIEKRLKDNRIQKQNVKAQIVSEKELQEKYQEKIDKEIVEFVMNGDTCYYEVLQEMYAPFAALENRTESWMNLLSLMKGKNMSAAYAVEREKQKADFMSRDYQGLMEALAEAQQFGGSISTIALNSELLKIMSVLLTVTGTVLWILFHKLSMDFFGFVGLLIGAAGAILGIYTILQTKKEFSSICRYVVLICEYQEFQGISSYAMQVTKGKELENIKSLGYDLYQAYYGRGEVQKIHDDKVIDIGEDYDRQLRLLTAEWADTKAEEEREKSRKIEKIKESAVQEREENERKKESTQNRIQQLSQKIEFLNIDIQDLHSQIQENNVFIKEFESGYKAIERNLQDEKWTASMDFTHGNLSDELYILPESGELDEYGHRRVVQITHKRKPLVITYEIGEEDSGGVSQVEAEGRIIETLLVDLMYSVYRMNSKESYAQLIVDEVGGSNRLKSNVARNAFNIIEIVGKLEDIRGRLKIFWNQRERLLEKGIQIQEINEKKYQEQERPEIYNILYIVYKSNERKGKLDEDIQKLIPECDKYGFLPVFICRKEVWERESEEKDTMYYDIKYLLNNSVLSFNGKQYQI
ncbi:MAG: hypothetical protein HFI31_06405 [Lachnospiraceae bacterium]|nr:hypothetical protein [Lachnospiraceae bacterium]